MRILGGRQARNYGEACALAFREAGAGDVRPAVADLFVWAAHTDRLEGEAEKSAGAAIRSRYGRKAVWDDERWLVPVPRLRYDARELPHLTFQIRVYLVAAAEVETASGDGYSITLIGAVGKPETVVLPLFFLQALLDDDLGRFQIIGRDGAHTTWDVPGFKDPVHLPNDFPAKLSAALRRKSVAGWLREFGSQGESIAPLVVGTLLGLQFHGMTETLPVERQLWSREVVVDSLTQMYGTARAQEMLQRVAPYLKAHMTNEEVIRFILQEAAKEM